MRRSASKPSAFSLIEMVLAIGAIAVVLGTTAGLLHASLKLDRAARASLVETEGLGRLARQLRKDIHETRDSDRVKISSEPATSLTLSLDDDRTIIYRWIDHAIVRDERKGEKRLRTESYTLGSLRSVRFERDRESGRTWVSLTLERKGNRDDGVSACRNPRIEARLGRDAVGEVGP